MPSEKQLRDALIYAFEHLKEQNSALHDLMTEMASIRDALIEIGPKYEEILNRHRTRNMADTKRVAPGDSLKFDETIRQLKG
jgi:hypothetical protein